MMFPNESFISQPLALSCTLGLAQKEDLGNRRLQFIFLTVQMTKFAQNHQRSIVARISLIFKVSVKSISHAFTSHDCLTHACIFLCTFLFVTMEHL